MKVLNFGSLNIDYVYRVDHFVRAGETLSSHSRELFCGGKGLNQSVAFSRAGAQTYHAGCIGKEGAFLLDMLTQSEVNTDFVRVSEDTPSGHAIIQVTDAGENCILLYGGANQTVDKEFITSVISHFGKGDLLMLQNEINNLPFIISEAKKAGMTVALNPSPFDEKINELDLSMIDWLIVNETEGKGITAKETEEDIICALLEAYPDMHIILTLGGDGAVYADSKVRARHGIFPASVVDTTAAGDTFTGYFFTHILRGDEPSYALRVASAASSIAVSRKGAAPSIPNADEVEDLLKAN